MIEAIRSLLFGLACLVCIGLFWMIGNTEIGLAIYFIAFILFLAYTLGENWKNRNN